MKRILSGTLVLALLGDTMNSSATKQKLFNPITQTNLTNLFLPKGYLIPSANYASLRIQLNISSIFLESAEVCHLSAIMQETVNDIKDLSGTNAKILMVLKDDIQKSCQSDIEILDEIRNAFGITSTQIDNKILDYARSKRQILVALGTIAVTSLISWFTSSELINMSGRSNDEDDLVDNNNHLVSAIQNHESRMVRLEKHQKLLQTQVEKLTKRLVLSIQREEIFTSTFAASTFAEHLNTHIRTIRDALFTLLESNRLHPSLVEWKLLKKSIIALKERAASRGYKLMLESNADVFQFHSDFVAYPSGRLVILTHIPLASPSSELKLYEYISTPFTNFNTSLQFQIKSDKQFLAINQDETIYAELSQNKLHNECNLYRDSYICNNLNIMNKVGRNSDSCTHDLYTNNLKAAKLNCQVSVVKSKPYAAQISSDQIYIYSPRPTHVTFKCMNEPSVTKMLKSPGSAILSLRAGCKVTSEKYVFSRGREMISESIIPKLTGSFMSDLSQEYIKDNDDLKQFMKR